jgi:hypothetical protein
MCVPAAIAIGSLALKVGSDIEAAHAQDSAASANKSAADAAESNSFNALATRQLQEQQSATDLDQNAARKTAGDIGLTHLAAAQNGVTGGSVDAIKSELTAQKSMYSDSVAENLHNQLQQIGNEQTGIEARTQSQINAVQPANPFAVGMKIAGSVLGTMSQADANRVPGGGGSINPDPNSGVAGQYGGLPPLTLTGSGSGGDDSGAMPLISQSKISNVGS